ncbi:MAG TPA: DNA-3-methyladenine glycosylase [Burkholderiaceae bacterium]|nr:DNA-3-methyladenine glycosylase [Burkholderiaceae bacterium]
MRDTKSGPGDASDPRRLRRADLPVDARALARFLIGKTLVHDTREGRTSGRIVETEAYVVGDAAGHAFMGETARNRSLFLERGRAYVYFSYGVHWCFNVSAETARVGAGVLVRALEPLEGLDLMRARRGVERVVDLARGPGRLAQALAIDRRLDGTDLCGRGPLWLGSAVRPTGRIGRSVRIGITKEAHRLLRFYERGNACVSGSLRMRS